MTASASIEIAGLKETIRSLNKVEPGLRKEFTANATQIAQPAIQEVQNGYQRKYPSGMSRNWSQGGNKKFPFTVAQAVKGVKLKIDASREAVSLIYIAQMNAGAQIWETAGRKTSNDLGNNIGANPKPNHSRNLGPSVFRKRREIENALQRLSMDAIQRVQKELN